MGRTVNGARAVYEKELSNDIIYGKRCNWYVVTDPRRLYPTGAGSVILSDTLHFENNDL